MFAQVRDAIASYPYPNTYVPGPGPTAIPSSRTSPGKSLTWRFLFTAGEGLELNLLGLSLGVDPGQAGTVAAGPRQARDGWPINGSRRSL